MHIIGRIEFLNFTYIFGRLFYVESAYDKAVIGAVKEIFSLKSIDLSKESVVAFRREEFQFISV